MTTVSADRLDNPQAEGSTPVGRALSWSVHAFTASGAVLGALALLAIAADELGRAVILMLLSLSVDSIDGTLARAVGVRRHLPQIDGRRMDDIIDYLNYVIVPAVFMVQAGSVLAAGWVALPILASACGFARQDAKTEDDFFLGFPSYWNVLAFYLWLLDFSPLAGTLWVVGLSMAVFVPYRYVYPSKLANLPLRYFVSYLGLAWAILLGGCVLWPDLAARYHVVAGTLLYPAFYVALSFWLGRWWQKPS